MKFTCVDQPVYYFHSGIPLIPDPAVVILKQLWYGEMTNVKITEEMKAAKPGLILLANDTRVMPFQHLLQTEFRLVYQDALHRLYALRSIANKVECNDRTEDCGLSAPRGPARAVTLCCPLKDRRLPLCGTGLAPIKGLPGFLPIEIQFPLTRF